MREMKNRALMSLVVQRGGSTPRRHRFSLGAPLTMTAFESGCSSLKNLRKSVKSVDPNSASAMRNLWTLI
jgi:hypothetical protein